MGTNHCLVGGSGVRNRTCLQMYSDSELSLSSFPASGYCRHDSAVWCIQRATVNII